MLLKSKWSLTALVYMIHATAPILYSSICVPSKLFSDLNICQCFRDLLIDHERELRKSLEEKILQHHLVDMYGDPSVNDELNDRLPRTKDKALGRSRHHKR